jgi:hypothetical protein
VLCVLNFCILKKIIHTVILQSKFSESAYYFVKLLGGLSMCEKEGQRPVEERNMRKRFMADR